MENTIDMFTQIKEVLYESNGSSSGAIQLEKLFNSLISHHLDKLTEEIKENVRFAERGEDEYDYDYSVISKESITKITAEYKLKNKL